MQRLFSNYSVAIFAFAALPYTVLALQDIIANSGPPPRPALTTDERDSAWKAVLPSLDSDQSVVEASVA